METRDDLKRGFTPLGLKMPVGNGLDNDDEDVRRLKQELTRVQALEPSGLSQTGIIDRPTLDGIRAFQQRQGLAVDGVVKPGGETERALNRKRLVRTMARNANRLDAAREGRGTETNPALTGRPARRPEPNRTSSSKGGGKLAAMARDHGVEVERRTSDLARGKSALAKLSPEQIDEILGEIHQDPILGSSFADKSREVQVAALGAIPVVYWAISSGIGVGAALLAQDPETRRKTAEAVERGVENAGDNLAGVGEAIWQAIKGDGNPGGRSGSDMMEAGDGNAGTHNGEAAGFQAVDPQPPEPPRDFDPEDIRDVPTGPPGLRPVDISDIPPLPGFEPKDREHLVEVFPDQSDQIPQLTLVNRNETEDTRQANTDVLEIAEQIGREEGLPLKIDGGGFDAEKGEDRKETHLPRDRKRGRAGLIGGNFIDATIIDTETNRRLLIQTVDTLSDGKTLSKRENNANWRAAMNKETGDILVLVAKPGRGERIDMESFREFIRPFVRELGRSIPGDQDAKPADPRDMWQLFDVKRRP